MGASDEKPQTSKTLRVDFGPESTPWRNIDDVVMGGVLLSDMPTTETGTGVFSGVLSLESGGGFAEIVGLSYQGYNGVVHNPDRPYCDNATFAALPVPDLSLIDQSSQIDVLMDSLTKLPHFDGAQPT